MKAKPQFEATRFTYVDKDRVSRSLDLSMGRHNSREACGVWFFGHQAWKIFSSRSQCSKMTARYKLAKKKGVPIPEHEFIEGMVTGDPARPAKEGFAFVSTYITGRFFALEKGTGLFQQVVRSITDPDILSKMEKDLVAAEQIGLRDPQGFINETSASKPILFIDIHTNTVASRSLIDMRKLVSARCKLVQGQSH